MDKEMAEACEEFNQAWKMFNEATTPERVDEASLRIAAAQARIAAILNERKGQNAGIEAEDRKLNWSIIRCAV